MTERPPGPDGAQEGMPPQPPSYANTANAERYVLEADAMRRRQLRSALLHGSTRTWREHSKVWPGVVVGLIVAALILAGTAVRDAIASQADNPTSGVTTPPPSAPPTSDEPTP